MNSGGDNNFGQNPSGANPWASSTPNNPMQSNPAATPVQPIQPTQPDLGPAPFAGPSSANLSQSVSGTPMMMGGGFNAPAGPIVSSGAGTAPAAPITPRPSGMPARRQFRSAKATPAAPVATPTAMRSDTPDFFSQAYTDNVMQANANAYDQAVKKGKMKKIGVICGLVLVLIAVIAVGAVVVSNIGKMPQSEVEVVFGNENINGARELENMLSGIYHDGVDIYDLIRDDTVAHAQDLLQKYKDTAVSLSKYDGVGRGAATKEDMAKASSIMNANIEHYEKVVRIITLLNGLQKGQDVRAELLELTGMSDQELAKIESIFVAITLQREYMDLGCPQGAESSRCQELLATLKDVPEGETARNVALIKAFGSEREYFMNDGNYAMAYLNKMQDEVTENL